MTKKLRYQLSSTMLKKDKTAWFYHGRSGLCIVAEKHTAENKYVATTQTNISWARLCRAVDLHRAIEKQRSARRSAK